VESSSLEKSTMRTKDLFRLAAGAALLCAGCAPVEEPERQDSLATPVAKKTPVEVIQPRETNQDLNSRIEAALRQVHRRNLQTDYSFWTVFHGILGMGLTAELTDPDTGKRTNAIEYICNGGTIRGMEFIPQKDGLDVRTGPMFVGQGHQDQFVAELTQLGMPRDKKFVVNGKEYSFEDFIRYTKMRASVTGNQELSWAIIVIGTYLGTDLKWTNAKGEKLRFEDMVRYELNQPIHTAACGGTHRLFGLAWVYHLHLRKGGKKEGVWKDVADKLAHFHRVAKQTRNPEGTFSTKYLDGRADGKDPQLKISTSGHVFEFLSLSLPDSELKKPWMQEAASALAQLILDNEGASIESGALYHAAHGLHLYQDRVYGNLKSSDKNSPVPLLPPEEDTVAKSR
jgi:hypothetical protein